MGLLELMREVCVIFPPFHEVVLKNFMVVELTDSKWHGHRCEE